MTVFFINTNPAWGGGEKWHFDTASMLKDHGFDTVVLTRRNSTLYKKSINAGLRTIPVRISNLSFLNPFRIAGLIRLFNKLKPGMVILNQSTDLKTAGIAAKLSGIKHIIYRRGNAKPVKNRLSNRFLFGRFVTAIIANSEETKRMLLKNNAGLFPVNKIKVLYNGINLVKFDQEPAPPLYQKKGTVILGSAGRLSAEKGHEHLIEMAKVLSQNHIPFILLIAGEGPLKEYLIQKVRENGLEETVVFAGFVDNIKSFMETIDVFILPSLWEGFGYVTIEAMACRKPVVAFHTGSNPEIIIDGKTGYLVSSFDIAELAKKISNLVGDPVLRNRLGEAGRERVETLFNSEFTDKSLIHYLTEFTG